MTRMPLSSKTILIADTNRTVGGVIAKILEKHGYHICLVTTGPAALNALLTQSVDLALLGADLPDMDAMEVTNLYRFHSIGRPRLPILGLIGAANGPKLAAWLDAGLDGCISKPIEPNELIEAVNACLDRDARFDHVIVSPQHGTHRRPADVGQGPAVDAHVLSDLEKLGGKSFVDNVIAQFAEDAAKLLPEISVSATAANPSLFHDQIHALRSCAGNVGAVGLYKLCLAAQSIGPADLSGDGDGYVARLRSEFERAISVLDQQEWRAAG